MRLESALWQAGVGVIVVRQGRCGRGGGDTSARVLAAKAAQSQARRGQGPETDLRARLDVPMRLVSARRQAGAALMVVVLQRRSP